MTPTSARDSHSLSPDALRWTCDPSELGFKSTAELPADAPIVGQARGLHALQFGLGIRQQGYNIFVSGPPGTGRSSYSRLEIERRARGEPVPPDWCYVRSFATADQPVAISLPAGEGPAFREHVAEMVVEVREGLRRAFAGEVYEQERAQVAKRYEQQLAELWEQLGAEAKARGLALQRTPTGILMAPVDLQGRPIAQEVFDALPEAERTRLQARIDELREALADAQRKARTLEREGREALRQYDMQVARNVIDGPVGRLKEQYKEHPKVLAFLDSVEQDMLSQLSDLRAAGDTEAAEQQQRQELPFMRRDPYARYQVNLLVDHKDTKGAPVIVEANPIFYKLVGKAEYRAEFGALVTDCTRI